MKKEKLYKIYSEIISELRITFPDFIIQEPEYRISENHEGELTRFEMLVKMNTSFKFVSFWFRNSISENNTYSVIVSVGEIKSNNGFLLLDYLLMRGIDFEKNLFYFQLLDLNETINISKDLFNMLLVFFNDEEMRRILFTKFNLEVPVSYSPYK